MTTVTFKFTNPPGYTPALVVYDEDYVEVGTGTAAEMDAAGFYESAIDIGSHEGRVLVTQTSPSGVWYGEVVGTTCTLFDLDVTELKAKLSSALAAGGSGSEQVTITLRDGDSNPLIGASCYITSDLIGSTVVVNGLVTNGLGQAFCRLNPGTYYVWASHPEYTFTNPITLVVTDV